MALARRYDNSLLLLGTVCTILLCKSFCVGGAVERDIYTSRELLRRVRSSFYLLGYCSSTKDSKCSSLESVLTISEKRTRDSLIKTGLVVFDAAYWQPHVLTSSTATLLWFACHDGQHMRLSPVDAAGLTNSLAAAAQQQGAVCIAGQMQIENPGAAAAPAAAEPDAVVDAFLQGLDMYQQQDQRWSWIVGFNIACIVTAGFLAVYILLLKQYKHKGKSVTQPGPGDEHPGVPVGIFTAMPAAVAIKLGVDMLFQMWGFVEGGISWWWAVPIWLIVAVVLTSIVLVEDPEAQQMVPGAADVEFTAISPSSPTATAKEEEAELSSGVYPVCGAKQASPAKVSTAEGKSTKVQRNADADLLV